ncbi:MAG: thioether cross-link-forming SCIFF peptide maturase [Oscillospiraceae bacterium]|nr:thioether cross-link-forming SCIFF peptide maturase [Oscillospiraceae bacterium]
MIHAYRLHGKGIVLDIGSGSVHVADPLAYEMITQWEQARRPVPGEPEERTELRTEIEALIRDGKLFAPERFGETDFAALAAQRETPPVVKALCLHVSHTCNLTCDYCFAQAGRYCGPQALMPFGIGKQALDFLLGASGTRRNLEVDFFGGEPLMNWQVVKDLVAYARSREAEMGKRFRFTLTTNGLLIDSDVIDFVNREMANVVLSLDGRKEIHDSLRRTVSGKGSYETVVPKFRDLVQARSGKNYYMRGTFTHANPDFTQDIYHMAALGFRSLSMEPVVCAPESPHALTKEDIAQVLQEYERLALEMARRRGTAEEFSFYHYLLDLAHGPCLFKRIAGCGSGTEYLAVTPAGELYPCHQFVGEKDFCMGDIWRGVTNQALRGAFCGCTLYSRPQCRECWARLYCSGGCAANAYHASGSIRGIHEEGCILFRKRMECAIWLAAERFGNG